MSAAVIPAVPGELVNREYLCVCTGRRYIRGYTSEEGNCLRIACQGTN